MCDVDLPSEQPPHYRQPILRVPDLYRKWCDGRALDVCFICGCPLCEDCGDYIGGIELEQYEECPSPDPGYIIACEDCELWWMLDEDEDDWQWEE